MSEWHSPKYWRSRPTDERIRNLRIPPRYRNCTFDSFESDTVGPHDLQKAVRKWCSTFEEQQSEGMGLYIYGPTGLGKTHISVSALREVVTKNQCSGLFLNYDIYTEMVHDARNSDGLLPEMYGDPNLLKYTRRVLDVVVIDNLNNDRLTDYMANTTADLIESRWEMKLPTIITTSIIPDKLSSIFSPRTASIIKASCYLIGVKGSDYRLKDLDGEG